MPTTKQPAKKPTKKKRPKKPGGPKGWMVAVKRPKCKQTWMPDRVYVCLQGVGIPGGWGMFDVEGWSIARPRAYPLTRIKEHGHSIMREWHEMHSTYWTLIATDDAENDAP
jgi:hypothetical protein